VTLTAPPQTPASADAMPLKSSRTSAALALQMGRNIPSPMLPVGRHAPPLPLQRMQPPVNSLKKSSLIRNALPDMTAKRPRTIMLSGVRGQEPTTGAWLAFAWEHVYTVQHHAIV
jgi:hypothetical protein